MFDDIIVGILIVIAVIATGFGVWSEHGKSSPKDTSIETKNSEDK